MATNDAASELIAFTQEITDAEQNSRDIDQSFLEAHVGGDLVFHRTDGTVVGKTEFLERWKAGNPFTARFASDIAVKLKAGETDHAVITLLIHAMDKQGVRHVYRNLRFCQKRAGVWQIYAWHNVELRSSS